MQSGITKLVQFATVTVFAATLSLPAVAETHRWRAMHHHQASYRPPLTITKQREREAIVARPDPFHGPAAIVAEFPFFVVGGAFGAAPNVY
jgi:hypothetical protein